MAYYDLVSEITGAIAGLSPLLAEKQINRAWNDIRTERLWSWLVTDATVICPPVVTDGAAAIVQYTDTITLNVAASAAVLPQTNSGAVPGILQMQIRFGSSPTAGPIYSILAYDATTPTALILQLDRPITDVTNAASTYQFYRCYVIPPIDDFLKWEVFDDFNNAIALAGNRLTLTSAQLDMRDPQRTSQGLAYNLASFQSNRISNPVTLAVTPNSTVSAGTPIYELWPHPTQGQQFYCRIRRTGEDFQQLLDEQPVMVPDSLILARAYGWYAYPWAQANVGNFPVLKSVNWPLLISQAREQYQSTLLDTKRNDDEQQLQTVWNRGHGLRSGRPFGNSGDVGYPIDSNFLQSHLIRF